MTLVLFERFVKVAGELMAARGWSKETAGRDSVAASFVRPTADGFVAAASLEAGRGRIYGSWPEGLPESPLHASAWVGASHATADRLVRAASGDRGWGPAIASDVDELLDPPRDVEMPIATVDEVGPAVESLASILGRGLS
jgi:hypothetical protein